jgi:hypothetical protein
VLTAEENRSYNDRDGDDRSYYEMRAVNNTLQRVENLLGRLAGQPTILNIDSRTVAQACRKGESELGSNLSPGSRFAFDY